MHVVKASAAVALGSPEKHDVNADPFANVAGTLLPRLLFQDLAIRVSVVLGAADERLVFQEQVKHLGEARLALVVLDQTVHTGQFQAACFLLIDLARGNVSSESLVPFYLRHANGGIRAFQRVIVVAVVLERLAKRRRAVKADNAELRELFEMVAARYPENPQ